MSCCSMVLLERNRERIRASALHSKLWLHPQENYNMSTLSVLARETYSGSHACSVDMKLVR